MSNAQLEAKADEDLDFDDDDEFMAEYRAKRVQQMATYAAKPKFNSVLEISKPEWEQEITRAHPDVHPT